LSIKDSVMPEVPILELIGGLDLSKGVEAVTEFLSKIDGIGCTTHLFHGYFYYQS
jgi:hypothetical protein